VQRVAPAGRKTQKSAVSKNNTGRAACGSILPVTRKLTQEKKTDS